MWNWGVVWWNAEYLVSLCMPGGLPGSGFANYFIEGEPAFSVEDNAWRIKTKDQRIYEFRQADRDAQAKWNQCRQHISPIEELHAKAANEFDGRKRWSSPRGRLRRAFLQSLNFLGLIQKMRRSPLCATCAPCEGPEWPREWALQAHISRTVLS